MWTPVVEIVLHNSALFDERSKEFSRALMHAPRRKFATNPARKRSNQENVIRSWNATRFERPFFLQVHVRNRNKSPLGERQGRSSFWRRAEIGIGLTIERELKAYFVNVMDRLRERKREREEKLQRVLIIIIKENVKR